MHEGDNMVLTCLYCDDVRLEADGRSSILGWHAQDVLVAPSRAFPLVLHSLAVVLLLRLPAGNSVPGLTLKMLVGNEVLYSVAASEQDLQAMLADAQKAIDAQGAQTIRVVMKFPNLTILSPGALCFVAKVGESEVRSNPLHIQLQGDD
jgi:hypothetical protein